MKTPETLGKTSLFYSLASLLVLLTAVPACAQDRQPTPLSAFYAGYSGGLAVHSPSLSTPTRTASDSIEFSQGLYAGYQFSSRWAAEGFWLDTGDFNLESTVTGNTAGVVETELFGVGGLYQFYRHTSLDTFITAGVAEFSREVQFDNANVSDQTFPYLGAGVRWSPIHRLQLRAGYTFFDPDLQIATAGVAWYFTAPLPAPSDDNHEDYRGAATFSCDELSVYYDGVHFESGSIALSAAATQELDALVRQLSNLPSDIEFEIRGHADASGSESLNYGLSVVRAQTIREYLGQHGIPLSRIQATGYGEWNVPKRDDTVAQRRADLILLGTERYLSEPCEGPLVQPKGPKK